jgi:hypothetical protein
MPVYSHSVLIGVAYDTSAVVPCYEPDAARSRSCIASLSVRRESHGR